jgi:L-ribulose-5-phosphate 3-epimerase
MLTTNITDTSKVNETILRTASKLGIKFIKLGYWEYAGFGQLHKQRAEVKARCNDIAGLCADMGITAGFHNHSDVYIGASPWDIEYAIHDTPKQAMGLYWDPAHATIEGGSSVWEQGLDLLSDRLVMLAVKDFRWANGKHRYAGGRIQSMEFCPLEMGNTPWPLAIKRLRELKFDGPISFHSEYQGQFSFKDLTVGEVIEQTKKDVTLFRNWWDEAM